MWIDKKLIFIEGNGGFWAWVCLVGTHLIETNLWYSLAIEAGAIQNASFQDFITEVAKFQKGKNYFILLIIVPAITLLFFLSGPNSKKKKEEKTF